MLIDVNSSSNVPVEAEFEIIKTSDDKVDVIAQLKNSKGDNISVPVCLNCYFSADPDGLSFSDSMRAVDAYSTPDRRAFMITNTMGSGQVHGACIFDADGHLHLNLVDVYPATSYFVVVFPSGQLAVSDLIEFL